MTEISYKRNHWEKGNVLTAEKLNATEVALESVITKINGVITENDSTVPISDAEHLASIQDITTRINALDYVVENEKPENEAQESWERRQPDSRKTILSLTEENGIIHPTYQDIPKATTTNTGLMQVGSNLIVNSGTVSLSSSITGLNALTDFTVSQPESADANGNYKLQIKAIDNNIYQINHYDAQSSRAFNYMTLGLQNNTILIGTQARDASSEFGARSITTTIGELIVNRTSTLTGNTTIGGTLGVTGNTSLNGTLGVTGKSTLSSLQVTGTSTLNAFTANGAATLNDVLSVTGNTTLNTLIVGSKTTENNTTTITGSTTLYGPLNVEDGLTTLSQLSVNYILDEFILTNSPIADNKVKSKFIQEESAFKLTRSITQSGLTLTDTVLEITGTPQSNAYNNNTINVHAVSTIFDHSITMGGLIIQDIDSANPPEPDTILELVSSKVSSDEDYTTLRTLDRSGNEFLYGDLTVSGDESIGGDLTIKGNINMVKFFPYDNIIYRMGHQSELSNTSAGTYGSYLSVTKGEGTPSKYSIFNYVNQGEKLSIGGKSGDANITNVSNLSLHANHQISFNTTSNDSSISMNAVNININGTLNLGNTVLTEAQLISLLSLLE